MSEERTSRRSERARHRRGMLRVLGYFAVVGACTLTYSAHQAHAEYKNQTMEFGRQMVELAKASNHELTKIVFNGQVMFIGSSSTEDSPSNVLTRYQDYCKANPGQPTAGWDAFEQKVAARNQQQNATPATGDAAPAKVQKPEIAKSGFVRTGDETEGVVACFVKGPNMKPTVEEAFKSLMTTGDLGALGELRYVYVKKSPDSGKSLVLQAWTDAKFNLLDMMSTDETKDVAGEDFPEIPRMPNTVRTISARAEGMPYGINIYRSKEPAEKAVAFYDQEMRSRGWTSYDPEMKESEIGGIGRGYVRKGVVMTLASTRESDGGSSVSLGLAGVAPHENKLGRAD